jgi:hypothetical protein
MTSVASEASGSGLFTGPDRYVGGSPWHPLAAALLTVVASVSALLVGLLALVAYVAATGQAESFDDTAADKFFSLASDTGVATAAGTQLASLAIVWLAAGYKGRRREVLQLAQPSPRLATLLHAGLVLVLATAALELLLYLTTRFDIFVDTEWLREGLASPYWWGTVLIAVVLAPLWEEVAFRGFLLSALAPTKVGFWGGATISNTLWTLLHWGYQWQGLVSVFFCGMVLSWILKRTGSLWAPIAAHALANVAALAFAYFAHTG